MSDAILENPLDVYNAHQWQIVPRGVFSRHFNLALNGAIVATLQMALWTEGCEFTIAGHDFTIHRKSIWKDGFVLQTAGQNVCDVKRDFWSRQFELSTADQAWILRPTGWFTRTYQLVDDGREVGSVRPTGWFTRARVADFHDNVPPPVQMLAIFLVLLVSQRQQRHSSSGG